SNEKHVVDICDLITEKGYDLNIWAYARIDTVNELLLQKMKKAGINWLAFGIESAASKVREGVAKRFNQEKIKKAIEMTRAAGIYVLGNFIFGLPDDDLETMQETLNMAMEFNFEYANFYCAMAYPGSKLFQDAVDQGLKLPDTWHGYSQFGEDCLPLPTKYLSASQVLRFRDEAFLKYHLNPDYLDMMERTYGKPTADHIKDMCKIKLKRKYA
ncbi:MAG: B12-binding domain-containing radical SAM protein, partial [Desulfocucumaceae bacterium]